MTAVENTKGPNILMIQTDQLNTSLLSCYGGPVPMPNLERIAAQGAVFDNAVCPFPVCSPSRASIVTGQYPHIHGIIHNVDRVEGHAGGMAIPETEEGITSKDVTTDRLLHEAGWRTVHSGKWHLTQEDPPYFPRMFREHQEYAAVMEKKFAEIEKRPRETWMDWYRWILPVIQRPEVKRAVDAMQQPWRDHPYADFLLKVGKLNLPLEDTFDHQVTSRALEEMAVKDERPFMLTASLEWPHDPNVCPSPFYEQVTEAELVMPKNAGIWEKRFDNDFSRMVARDLGPDFVREFRRVYAATLRLVDFEVGRLLDGLEATGRDGNTLVVFLADHGDMAGGHGMIWKSTGSFYDDVSRVPLIMRWPGRIVPGRSKAPANLVDLMPTFLEAAGVPAPSTAQGVSLLPRLTGTGEGRAPRYAFCERLFGRKDRRRTVEPGLKGSFMVRGEDAKYVRFHDGEEHLYDLKNDPGETKNLAGDSGMNETLGELRGELNDWMTRTNYPR